MIVGFLQEFLRCPCGGSNTTFDVNVVKLVPEKELNDVLREAQTEAAYRSTTVDNVFQSMVDDGYHTRVLVAIETLIQYYDYTFTQLAFQLSDHEIQMVWLYTRPVQPGRIALHPTSKFSHRNTVHVFFGTLKQFNDSNLQSALTDAGFDRPE